MKLALAEVIATSFYSGYAPKAPGTAGALVGVLLVYLLHRFTYFTSFHVLGFVLLFLIPSVWATNVLIDALKTKDPQCVVVDEVLGQMLAFVGSGLDQPLTYLLAFGFFRLFDIYKPFPVRQFERLSGGWGVILDDLMAGLYSAAMLYILRNFLNLPL
ncbi:MAG: phosphatidylglycerophosphatase A [Acidobacteria bacterium]|nr:phosphatidylglycerophosphatase A [Acidobacteriota bacterium]